MNTILKKRCRNIVYQQVALFKKKKQRLLFWNPDVVSDQEVLMCIGGRFPPYQRLVAQKSDR